ASAPGFGATRRGGVGGSGLQHAAQQLDILGERAVAERELLDLAHRMHDGGMVTPTKFPADFRQRPCRLLLVKIHRDLTRSRYSTRPALGGHLAQPDVEML